MVVSIIGYTYSCMVSFIDRVKTIIFIRTDKKKLNTTSSIVVFDFDQINIFGDILFIFPHIPFMKGTR